MRSFVRLIPMLESLAEFASVPGTTVVPADNVNAYEVRYMAWRSTDAPETWAIDLTHAKEDGRLCSFLEQFFGSSTVRHQMSADASSGRLREKLKVHVETCSQCLATSLFSE